MWCLAAESGARSRGSWVWGLGAGLVAWLCLFVSFSLLPAIALIPVIAFTAMATRELRAPQLATGALGMFAGFALPALWTRTYAGYDMVLRYERAMAHDAQWKHWNPALDRVLHFTALDLLEFAYWLGPALAVAALVDIVRQAAGLRWTRTSLQRAALPVALLASLVAMAVLGKTEGEVVRLWLFMVPLALIVSVRGFAYLGQQRWRHVLVAVVALQAGWTVLLKRGQDFW